MKVKDFIKKLEKLPQDAELLAKEEHGWFYPADIIKVYENQYIILGKVQHVVGGKIKKVF